MPAYIALLRALNLMGTRGLPMTDLKSLCEDLGFQSVRTWIASGNVVLQSRKSESAVKSTLESALTKRMGRPVGVLVRTAPEIAAVLRAHPFPQNHNSHVMAIFLDAPPAADALATLKNHTKEELRLGLREIYVYYPDGQGQSRLIIPALKHGTARNMNTIAKLAQMAAELK
jgi:uncharacterized protein (DUF1697 family)